MWRQRVFARLVAAAGVIASSLGALNLSGDEKPPSSSDAVAGGTGILEARTSVARASLSEQQIRRWIAALDADSFVEREKATRALITERRSAMPLLVESLSGTSAEAKSRVVLILGEIGSLDEIGPVLLQAANSPHGAYARNLLRARCLSQIELAAQLPNVDRLFRFWGTTGDHLLESTRVTFDQAKDHEQLTQVVTPLMGLPKKISDFSHYLTRLNELSVASDFQQSAGYMLAGTLARGLRENRPECVEFANRYLNSLEQLAEKLESRGARPYEIRSEIASRTSWSQGATNYLIRMLDSNSATGKLVNERIGISVELMKDGFFQGLASAENTTYMQGVGRVHIVDLLGESLQHWPPDKAPEIISTVSSAIVECAKGGDKAKALVYLEVLDAFRDLERRKIAIDNGVGAQLAERLLNEAHQAENHRAFYSARVLHKQLVTIVQSSFAMPGDGTTIAFGGW